ncbi:hypothetical protein HMPREF9144_2092 [Prevotella pallens ATCC 700821]|uniref:Uncharacterized protein n=1 Tax=Prevotella pallens ATCC 700821 TaxID=997353 RepID=F9DKA0_9BACT|nr:hypothetical protein HMPREF9144_2092 [Prevotella pallens ATCC 700821]
MCFCKYINIPLVLYLVAYNGIIGIPFNIFIWHNVNTNIV